MWKDNPLEAVNFATFYIASLKREINQDNKSSVQNAFTLQMKTASVRVKKKKKKSNLTISWKYPTT